MDIQRYTPTTASALRVAGGATTGDKRGSDPFVRTTEQSTRSTRPEDTATRTTGVRRWETDADGRVTGFDVMA